MQLTKYATAITISALSLFSTPVIAEIDKGQWVDFGKVHSGEILKLNERSINFENMLVDDTLNNQDGFYNDNDKFPKMKVVVFEYSLNNKKRIAYTKSCNSGNLTANPSWKTYTSLIDNWPQYFRVDVDNVASQKMLQRVCTLSLEKQ
ncbi:hypothetical protein A0J48_021575 [Sphaerospermopsis aphanizomenoides BCCUSP55]|uniref:hypothetical protein n=1 Tax=Sphaerospermopsis aphanizomenoides TaxID=459663 RepID=UPI001905F62F|nr:hypothetical protein [Sphaerospermopsis aphanizomenoides]MBK1990085.1 hypothetical protein [Sphaerospermopsis aphanizomenoides BCCUSP55]